MQKRYSYEIVAIGIVLIVIGFYELLVPFSEQLQKLGISNIQFVLLGLRPLTVAHALITLLVPILLIVGGALFILRRRIGWWLLALVVSFCVYLYGLSLVASPPMDGLRAGVWSGLVLPYTDMLVRVVIFVISLITISRPALWPIYFRSASMTGKKMAGIAGLVIAGNAVVAAVLYGH